MFCSKNDKVRVYAFADEANAMIDRQIEAMKRNHLNLELMYQQHQPLLSDFFSLNYSTLHIGKVVFRD